MADKPDFITALRQRLAETAKPVHKRIVKASDLGRIDPSLIIGSKIVGFSMHHYFDTDDVAIMLENPAFSPVTFPERIPELKPQPAIVADGEPGDRD